MPVKNLLTPMFQKINGVIRKVLYETIAKQVFMSDGTDIETKINSLSNAVSGQSVTYVVADIAARDAIGSPNIGDQAWVKDATADETVTAGAAKYIYESEEAGWVKTAEAESMDLAINWNNIVGKPASEADDIDAAVTATKMLDGHELTVGVDSGELLLDGNAVGGRYGAYVSVGPEDEGFEAAVAALNLPDGAFFTVLKAESGDNGSGDETENS